MHLNPPYDPTNCCVQNISRPIEFPLDTYELGYALRHFYKPDQESIQVWQIPVALSFRQCEEFDENNEFQMGNREFVKVTCTASSTKYFNYHTRVIPSKFQSKIDYWKEKRKPVNILILVLDSTSRADAHRNLPKTMEYLLNELNFVEFNGYHVLGEPTIRNAVSVQSQFADD